MFKIYKYNTIDSTNAEAKRLLQGDNLNLGTFSVPAVIVSNHQTAGRGRQGKTFYSPENTGLYMSVIDEFPSSQKDISLLTIKISMAVHAAIFECTGICTGIKWVNDLYLENKKICGILTESIMAHDKHYIIIGVGVNVFTENFPTEISSLAGSLDANHNFSKTKIDELCQKTAENILNIKNGAFSDMDKYRELSVVLGKEVEYIKNGNTFTGIAVEITESGGLAINLDGGARDVLHSGEISLKKWG